MKTWIKVLIGAVILIAGVWIFYPSNDGPGEYDEFAQCLTDAGAVMYGTSWCSHCQDQKKRFGKSFQYVNYVDCDKNKDECLAAGVSGYPTWIMKGESYSGNKPLMSLASLTGCEL